MLYDGDRGAGEEDVLKITTTQDEPKTLTVHLCGQLTSEYVPELAGVLNPESAPQIALDMSNVTFVDRKAMEFLCGVKSRVSIENIPASDIDYFKNNKREFIQGIVYIDKVPTKHYTAPELEMIFQQTRLDITALEKLEYAWDTEFTSPPSWMKAPYPWDWLIELRKR